MPQPTPIPSTDASAERGTEGDSYLPGLDGIRAIAVLLVLIYHAKPGWLPGGFLGVDTFFVVSGFIITRKLLIEWRETGRLAVPRFWQRRARRLLPALALLLTCVVIETALLHPSQMPSLRGDLLASLAYVQNWHLLLTDQSYFNSFGRPSPLEHLWSLAIEEQFYVCWPLLLWLLLAIRGRSAAMVFVVLGAFASVLTMALLYGSGAGESRLYYGTDTRAAALLIGAALGLLDVPHWAQRPWLRFGLDLSGLVALGLLISAASLGQQAGPFFYRGGFAAVEIITALLIIAAVNPKTMVGRALSLPPLRWLGVRSYGIYLWHWPVLLLIWPQEPTLPVLALQLLAIVTIAALSYHFVETPLRRRDLKPLLKALNPSGHHGLGRPVAATSAALMVGALAILIGLTFLPAANGASLPTSVRLVNPALASTSPAEGPPAPEVTSAVEAPPESAATPGAGDSQEAAPATPEAGPADPQAAGAADPLPTPPPPPAPIVLVAPSPLAASIRVTALGDSVMLGAAAQLASYVPGIDLDAAVGRQVSEVISILWDRQAELAPILLLDIGNNGSFSRAQFDQIMAIAGPSRLVIFLNLKVERNWQDQNNNAIATGVAGYTNARLVDWRGLSEGHPEFFAADQTHLSGLGVRYYVSLIANAVPASP